MLIVANRIYANPAFAEAFEERFRTRTGLADEMPGFLFNQLLRPAKEGDPYVVLTYWESYGAFKAGTEPDGFDEGQARSDTLPEAAFDKPNQLEIHQIIRDSRDPNLEVEAPLELEITGHKGE